MRWARLFGSALFLATCGPLWAAPTSILVDTSRSIPPAQFEKAKADLAGLLPQLLAEGPVALYAFNDSPVRVVDFTTDAAALQQGLQKLEPGGKFTLLYDCVFTAVKAIQDRKSPGTILLVTDGKDENSAVTLEDAASRATEAHVAVVTVGVGDAEEKGLRRLAALTEGQYAGTLAEAGPQGILKAWGESEGSLKPFPPPPAPPKAEPAPAPPAPAPSPARTGFWVLALFVLAGFAVVVAVLLVLLRRTKPPEERACERCGRTLKAWEADCPDCLAQQLAITKPGEEPQGPAAAAVPELDPTLLRKAPSPEMLEHTLVLDEVPVLVLQRGKNPARMFQLPKNQVVSVGRDKVNTLSVADQTLSGQHFRIVPKEDSFYLVDLQSTNGTFMDGERVTLKELKPGSVIHAGQCDFLFKREQKRLN